MASVGFYKAHGSLMYSSFGLLFPAAIIIAKYGQRILHPIWFHLHWILQVLGIALATVGLAIALKKFDALADTTHAKLGLALGVLIWLQLLLSVVRPQKGKALRPYWYVCHWLFGTGAVILGWYNIFVGLNLYFMDFPETSDHKSRALSIVFSVQVAVISFAYLFMERWQHILNQGKNHSTTAPKIDIEQHEPRKNEY